MYFTALVKGHSHLWRQRFPNGEPEQLTFGPTEEGGIAVAKDGRSIITSLGLGESALWIHDQKGERPLSSEGEIVDNSPAPFGSPYGAPPSFDADGKILYYLLREDSGSSGWELHRMNVSSGQSEAVCW